MLADSAERVEKAAKPLKWLWVLAVALVVSTYALAGVINDISTLKLHDASQQNINIQLTGAINNLDKTITKFGQRLDDQEIHKG